MSHARLKRLAETSYPAVQLSIAPRYRGLRDAEIEALLEEHFPGASPEDVEDLGKTLRKTSKILAPIARRALPGIIQGASTGMAAGPWGAVIGGLAGGTASVLAGGGSQPVQRQAPAAAPRLGAVSRPSPAPTLAPAPATPPTAAPVLVPRSVSASPRTAPAGSQDPVVDATARMILLIARPEVQLALLALLMGQTGRRNVLVRGRTVPVDAVADALAEVASELAEATLGRSGGVQRTDWIADVDGATLIDATNPSDRAALLFANLMADPAPPMRVLADDGVEDEPFEDEADDEWDTLESYEA